MLRVESFSSIQEIPLDRAKWNELVDKNSTNSVFQTYEWFVSWWKNFGNDRQLLFLVASDHSGVLGFAPFMINRESYCQRIIRFVGDTNADYCDFIINGNRLMVIDAFITHLYKLDTRWTGMMLLNIPASSTTQACLETICAEKGYHIQHKSPVTAPALVIKNHREHALACTKKYSINRHLRKLEKIGRISFENLHDKQDILPCLDLFFDQHIRRYQKRGLNSQFSDVRNQQFFRDLVNNFDHTGQLIFSVLKLDDKPVACHLGFEYDHKLIWYKPTFDIDYSDYSPGSIMLKKLIEYAIQSEHVELDFTIGDESFKDRFANRTRYNVNIAIYRLRIFTVLLSVRRSLGFILQKLSRLRRKRR